MNAFVWFVSAFGAALLTLTAIVFYLQSRRRETQSEVLARMQMGIAAGEPEDNERLTIAKVNNPVLLYVYKRLWRAGYEAEPRAVAIGVVVAAIAALLLALIANILLALMTIVLSLLVFFMFLQQKAGRRRQEIIQQLPDFLEYVIRALMAGNTLEEAFGSAARECREPLRGLFMNVSRQVRLGSPIEEALTQLALVQDLPDMHVIAMSARTNRRYGGSIRNMIKSIIQVIRQRETAASELRALTIGVRWSAFLLAAIPIGITLYVLYINPVYFTTMWTDTTGRLILIGGFAWQLVGMAVIWRMMRSVTVL